PATVLPGPCVEISRFTPFGRRRFASARVVRDNAHPFLLRSGMPKTSKHKIEARLSPIHGNGVFAIEPIKKGERIVRYKGKLRTHAEVDEEYGDEDENGHTFLFTLNDDYVIDANVD